MALGGSKSKIAWVAQTVERPTGVPGVIGSSPTLGGTISSLITLELLANSQVLAIPSIGRQPF